MSLRYLMPSWPWHKKTIKSRVQRPPNKNAINLVYDSITKHWSAGAHDPFIRDCMYTLQLGLGWLKCGCEQLAHIVGSLIQVVTHTVTAKTLWYNVEAKTIKTVSMVSLLDILVAIFTCSRWSCKQYRNHHRWPDSSRNRWKIRS